MKKNIERRGRKRKYHFVSLPIGEVEYIHSKSTQSVLVCAQKQVPGAKFKCWKHGNDTVAILRLT